MTTFDAATEAYMARLLDTAPPLPDDLVALLVRAFAHTETPADTPLAAAA